MAVASESRLRPLTFLGVEEAIKDAEERIRVIEAGYRRLKTLLVSNEDLIREKFASLDRLRRTQEPALKSLYARAVSPYNINSTRSKLGLANLTTAIVWIDTDRVDELLDANVASPGLKILRKVKAGTPLSRLITLLGVPKVVKPISRLIRYLAVLIGREKDESIKLIDYETAAVFSPFARTILTHTIYNLTRGTAEGARVGVTAPLGGGKTTFAYLSLYAVLRFLGMDEEEALRFAWAVTVNDPLVLINLLKSITQHNVFVPAIIADDIASMISKHWIFESQHVRKAVSYLLRAVKISREGFGAIVFPSDTKDSMPKSLRESLDIEYNGEMIQTNYYRSTLWLNLATETKTRNSNSGVRRQKVIQSICATACPPLLTPPAVYDKLSKQKKAARVAWLTKAQQELVKDMRGEEGDKKRKKRGGTLQSLDLEDWGLPELL